CICVFYAFFFQAEDGIRDGHVTGVQTCALPILFMLEQVPGLYTLVPALNAVGPQQAVSRRLLQQAPGKAQSKGADWLDARGEIRSEERRVGKECRYGWLRYHEKKKKINYSIKNI